MALVRKSDLRLFFVVACSKRPCAILLHKRLQLAAKQHGRGVSNWLAGACRLLTRDRSGKLELVYARMVTTRRACDIETAACLAISCCKCSVFKQVTEGNRCGLSESER